MSIPTFQTTNMSVNLSYEVNSQLLLRSLSIVHWTLVVCLKRWQWHSILERHATWNWGILGSWSTHLKQIKAHTDSQRSVRLILIEQSNKSWGENPRGERRRMGYMERGGTYMIRADEAVGTARARCNCCCMMSTHIVECMDLLLLIFANQVPYIPQPATQCKLDSLIRIISKNHLRYAYFEEDCTIPCSSSEGFHSPNCDGHNQTIRQAHSPSTFLWSNRPASPVDSRDLNSKDTR